MEAAGLSNEWLVEEAKAAGIRLGYGGRIVVHHQISPEAVQKLKDVLSTVVKRHQEGGYTERIQVNGGGYGSLKRT